MKELEYTISRLRDKAEVDSVFLTGSYGADYKPYSDIDLVIILEKHEYDLTSLFTWVGDKFADIFFFDHSDLNRIENSIELPAGELDAVFINWLKKAIIQFDKSGKITRLKGIVESLEEKIVASKLDKDIFWQKINYNFVVNSRYFYSHDPLYLKALEIRLLYSVSELLSGYFKFWDISWQGEKKAIKYLESQDSRFYKAFILYTEAFNLNERFEAYCQMIDLVFPENFKLWKKGDILPQAKDPAKANNEQLIKYWQKLIK